MKKIIRRTVFVLIIIVTLVAIAAGAMIGQYYFRVQHFPANAAAGYQADFYLYVSPGAKDAARGGGKQTILVQPNNSGTNSDDLSVHRSDAWWTGWERTGVADDLNVILLVPAFVRPAKDWQIYTHALDRDSLTTKRSDIVRLDLQLLAMVDKARRVLKQLGIETDEKILIQGFSASGMFANRFTALHPDRVKAAAIGSPGGWPIAPVAQFDNEPLPYPAGVADFEALTGKPFAAEQFKAVPQIMVLGSLDDNDSLDFGDGWEKDAATQVDRFFGNEPQTRWKNSEKVYRAAGVNAQFVLVEGVGHDRKKLQSYSTEFFKRVLGK
jgi:pimeloyl-ACP methyl ester carboxylesterase